MSELMLRSCVWYGVFQAMMHSDFLHPTTFLFGKEPSGPVCKRLSKVSGSSLLLVLMLHFRCQDMSARESPLLASPQYVR